MSKSKSKIPSTDDYESVQKKQKIQLELELYREFQRIMHDFLKSNIKQPWHFTVDAKYLSAMPYVLPKIQQQGWLTEYRLARDNNDILIKLSK